MKKYFFYLSIALVAFVVASCGLKGNHTMMRPMISGYLPVERRVTM